jgi:EmrB/QacA subfamily drug resistance transporter
MAPAQRRTLAAAVLGTFVAFLDGTVVNVALPAIEAELGGGLAGQQWVVNAYLLLLGSLILVGGSLGDLYGERRIYAIGLAGFAAVSLGCALAPSIEVLVVLRAAQGAFGALLTPAALALIVAAFPPEQRGAAVGSWTAWAGIAGLVGPLAGGWLVEVASWRWIFALNVPAIAVTLWLVAGLRIGMAPMTHARVDWVGAALAAVGLAGPTIALVEQPARGWGDPLVAGGLVAGVALLAAFRAWERRHLDPMLPPELFADRRFSVANLLTFGVYAGLGIVFFLLVIFLQAVVGFSAVEAGLATLPTTVIMFVSSKRFGALADRIGARPLLVGGPLVAAAGLLLFLRVGADVSYWGDVLPALLVFAVGLSMTVAPLTATVLAGVSDSRAGIASGVNNAVARVAGLLATAAIATVAGLPPDLGAAPAEEAVAGFHRAMVIGAALVAGGGLLGLLLPTRCTGDVRAEDCAGATPAVPPVRRPQPEDERVPAAA